MRFTTGSSAARDLAPGPDARPARLPLAGLLARACLVLPFTAVFALVSWIAGDANRAVALILKSYLSATAVLLLVSTTPVPLLLRGLEMSGVPRFLLMVAQFLYRYLFVISEEAQDLGTAARSRGASVSGILAHRARFQAAGGALALAALSLGAMFLLGRRKPGG